MSVNHFSPDFQESVWWAQQHHHHHHQHQQTQSVIEQQSHSISNTNTQFHNHNKQIYDQKHTGDVEPPDLNSPSSSSLERESMFEKHLTPSDVGKLNRLVIPKQHAERYFPLNNNINGVSNGGGESAGEKGLLLSFEDESGKCWRFRYSYWNSSQSYVLTKGWSRYVKEKRLDAGDVVLFDRHRVEMDRFFIGWRRRATLAQDSGPSGGGGVVSNNSGGGEGWTKVFYSAHPYLSHPFPYQPDYVHAGAMEQKKTTSVSNTKRLIRLFGVNMECELDEDQSSEPPTPDGSSLSSQGQAHHHQTIHFNN